ncbi:hypothetical protein GXP67_12380 [Rhodocytophaga rosea]|uniref:Uncharacterized protein n=1 Tax=Rhodocytophaga rosea TaxID=2704465 RepID=A0A6C0GHK2_9BACT|nr:hypothetical protein [Rhodocytophaga rosea]QHT67375.1 hypothetical protein GXP67_12380 [Rhodocytophaga rosea]
MKTTYLLCILTMLLITSCQKSEVAPEQSSLSTLAKAARRGNDEIQTLIRAWNEWVFTRPFSVAPFNDPTGEFQYLDQPYSSGIFMLGPGASPDPIYRTVTISLSQYQYVFTPLVGRTAYAGPCDPTSGPKGGQTFEAYFQIALKESLNGPSGLILSWDGVSLLSKNPNELRANSGVWSFTVHPDYSGCETPSTTVYADGYWAKMPLTLGTHTLIVGGAIDAKKEKFTFSSIVTYTIHVIE